MPTQNNQFVRWAALTTTVIQNPGKLSTFTRGTVWHNVGQNGIAREAQSCLGEDSQIETYICSYT
jgi:hypothetical protein